MIKKLRNKFILTAMLSVFILLLLILGTINFVNFHLVAADADQITMQIERGQGKLDGGRPEGMMDPNNGNFNNGDNTTDTTTTSSSDLGVNQQELAGENGGMPGGMNGYGPNSPELGGSTRYFTYSFDQDGVATSVAYQISAVSEEEALDWAEDLKDNSYGWTRIFYRYRVWIGEDGNTYVTVIDQSRELLPSFRVLIASIIGGLVGLVIAFLALIPISKKVVDPIVEMNNKQNRFIMEASYALKNPITVIDTNRQIIEYQTGTTKETDAIGKEVLKLVNLSIGLDTLTSYEEKKIIYKEFDVSLLFNEIVASYEGLYKNNKIELNLDIEPNITYRSDSQALGKIFNILLDNSLKYSLTYTNFRLLKNQERLMIEIANDADDIKDGDLDSVFERFYRSEDVRASSVDGAGLGLSIVKEIVDNLGGRIMAKGENGNFIIKIEL